MDADFVEVGEQRRTERRASDRRAPRRRFDTLFAATLINHVEPRGTFAAPGAYRATTARVGAVVDLRV